MNNVTLFKSSVILFHLKVLNLGLSKFDKTDAKKVSETSLNKQQSGSEEKKNSQGYPTYSSDEDIYRKYGEEKEIDPEDVSKIKEPIEKNKVGARNGTDFNDDALGTDLDIPGSELDDEQENIGSEDEENNYYSLGGDNHNDLDENNDE